MFVSVAERNWSYRKVRFGSKVVSSGDYACRCSLEQVCWGILPPTISVSRAVPHSPEEKKKVLTRIRRIRGQCEGLERALEAGADCAPVLQQIAAIRGAVNGLMSEVLESHLREQFEQPARDAAGRRARVDEMTSLIRSYLK